MEVNIFFKHIKDYKNFINESVEIFSYKKLKDTSRNLIYSIPIDDKELIVEFKYFDSLILFDYYEKNNYMEVINKGAFRIINTIIDILQNFINNQLQDNQSIIVVPEDKQRENLYRRYIDKIKGVNIFTQNSLINNHYEEDEEQIIGVLTKQRTFNFSKNYNKIKEIFMFMDGYKDIKDFILIFKN